jgi:hypothetical protein
MWRLQIALCLASALLWSDPLGAAAPQQPAQGQAGAIDGSKSPELIPDMVVWLMLFEVIADGPGAPNYSTRGAAIRSAGFTEAEVTDVIFSANEAMSRIRAMEARIMPSAGSMDQKTRMLRSQRDAILADVVDTLLLRLSPDAAAKFRKHIGEHVKPRVRILP